MIELFKEYTEKRLELLKLQFTEKSSLTAGKLLYLTSAVIALLSFILLFNIGIGFYIGSLLGNYAYGLLIMAGMYLLAFIIVIYKRKEIKNTFANWFIKLIND